MVPPNVASAGNTAPIVTPNAGQSLSPQVDGQAGRSSRGGKRSAGNEDGDASLGSDPSYSEDDDEEGGRKKRRSKGRTSAAEARKRARNNEAVRRFRQKQKNQQEENERLIKQLSTGKKRSLFMSEPRLFLSAEAEYCVVPIMLVCYCFSTSP